MNHRIFQTKNPDLLVTITVGNPAGRIHIADYKFFILILPSLCRIQYCNIDILHSFAEAWEYEFHHYKAYSVNGPMVLTIFILHTEVPTNSVTVDGHDVVFVMLTQFS
jgi:hypothetical protein